MKPDELTVMSGGLTEMDRAAAILLSSFLLSRAAGRKEGRVVAIACREKVGQMHPLL